MAVGSGVLVGAAVGSGVLVGAVVAVGTVVEVGVDVYSVAVGVGVMVEASSETTICTKTDSPNEALEAFCSFQ